MTITDPLGPYSPPEGVHDEMLAVDGRVRDDWAQLRHSLNELGLVELHRRRDEAARLLEADGVTYHASGRPSRAEQSWRLDPVPVLIGSDEWGSLERGVIQRAELLALVLEDLYGPRDLVRRGLLPPEVVYGDPEFLRAADGVRAPGSALASYAVDMARDREGAWWVLSDRAQAPSGAGYALENRLVVSRVLPSLYRDAQVHRLAPFFRALRSALQDAAPPQADDPRIVVLTPGPWSETAFEHAYLASYLGYSLVEGGDLTVRDGRVWLRSLGRLEPVDVILRRVDSTYCDPLELRPDSELGVPGLLEAVRTGAVSLVNPIGSGILESAALLPFLPRIAEHLLGQSLRLPSVGTWWCGDDSCRSHVLANLDRLVLKTTKRTSGTHSVFGGSLSAERLASLRRRIEAEPSAWVGQEALALGTSPTLTEDGLAARRTVLRAFAVARKDSFLAMPGGLTRVAPSADERHVANQAGALSKDTWVLSSEPERLTGFWLQPTRQAAVEPLGMSSRAAENLFWLGRYAERAEGIVRLLRAVLDRRNEFAGRPDPAGIACLDILYTALTHVTATYPGFTGDEAQMALSHPGDELFALVVDEDRGGTLGYAVKRLLDNAYAVRDQLSTDTWLIVGNLDRELLELRQPLHDRQAAVQQALDRFMQGLLAFSGLQAESMVRDPGWHFLDAGRRIERAMHLAMLLRATITVERDTATDSLVLESVLTASESIITYRRRYRSRARLDTMLDLLVLDGGNPRSLRFQVDRLVENVAALPVSGPSSRLRPEERRVLELQTTVRLADSERLAVTTGEGRRRTLEQFLDLVEAQVVGTASEIDTEHFTHMLPQRSLSMPLVAGIS
jgi:uncharacterized circularly permuted ATP-grasp superfamily protein/uncharacterized alpha-E superfamily protein